MINLRYHIVSITAVFLALAIGVVMGTSFLGKATVDQLKKQIGRTETRIHKSEQENDRLAGEINRLNDAGKALRQDGQQLLADRLTGQTVLMIAAANVDRESLASLQSALAAAGADFKGTLVVTQKLRLDGEDAAKLGELLGTTTTSRSRARRLVTSRLAKVLLSAAIGDAESGGGIPGGGSTSTTAPTTTTVPTTRTGAPGSTTTTTVVVPHVQPALLTDLRDGGWLSYQPPVGGSTDDTLLTTGGYRYVVVSGPAPAVPDSGFLDPLLRDLAAAGPTPLVVASAAIGDEAESTRTAVVGPVRKDDTMRKNLSSVDDLERFEGQAAVVLALEQLNAVHGHYGIGGGATSLLPPPP